ncbi:kinase-like domain-containing protein [Clohesyomyces aquaticus]|uniref:Kinase-like domain-containing protein n=1 Tax=Clohesyomyces aquaticus TaxID=1231657 RepID=A0A1Y2A366_9PLEO|nr:kinase-like domain-containing protein [Clohesyomyces aquaticus]
MLLNRLAHPTIFKRVSLRSAIRMVSTLVGQSGRVYVQGELIQRHREDEKLNIYKAEYSFVYKRVPRPFFNLSQRLAAEFAGSRIHTILSYFDGTLLRLIQEDPNLSSPERRKIMRHVGEAIQELHHKDWIHIDVKPDNVLLNWTIDKEGTRTITDTVLGDFDIAFKSEGGKPRNAPFAIGNAKWRSPEGQTGKGVTKASDIFSYGLVCIYCIGGRGLLIIDNWQDLVDNGVTPEQEIQIGDEEWCAPLRESWAVAERAIQENPERRFTHWGKDIGVSGVAMLSGMTNLDPKARSTINQVLASPWWQEQCYSLSRTPSFVLVYVRQS